MNQFSKGTDLSILHPDHHYIKKKVLLDPKLSVGFDSHKWNFLNSFNYMLFLFLPLIESVQFKLVGRSSLLSSALPCPSPMFINDLRKVMANYWA